MSTPGPTPVAKVRSWTDLELHVPCPWCHDWHAHAFNGVYEDTRVIVAPCDASQDETGEHRRYKIQFITSTRDGVYRYEIDKEHGRYVAYGASLRRPMLLSNDEIEKRTGEFVKQLGVRRPWTDATEMHPAFGDQSLRKINVVFDRMARGDVSFVKKYLAQSHEKDIFLHGNQSFDVGDSDSGSDDKGYVEISGRTALHLAACYQYPDTVELLLAHGVDVNAVDISGRTALMEAALWGRLQNVRRLLEHGADKSLQCILNGRIYRAIDFALPTKDNERTRTMEADCNLRYHKRDAFARIMDQQIIVKILNDGETQMSPAGIFQYPSQRSQSSMPSCCFTPDSKAPREKTLACMIRPGGLPVTSSMSGWSHGRSMYVQLPGTRWVGEVMRLAELIGFPLDEWPDRDHGVPGQFHASHAEKQLIAYFVHKHMFLGWEIDTQETDEDKLSDMIGVLSLEETECSATRTQKASMTRLWKVRPETSIRGAVILSTKPVCQDCKQFVARVNAALDLKIKLRHLSREGSRWHCTS